MCIIGEIGSGKSSILSSIIGDMKHYKTDTSTAVDAEPPITIRGSIAYVHQVPWIQN